MDIAIQLQKVNLGDEKLIFKPMGIIKGKFIAEESLFLDELGYEYNLMINSTNECDRYFCAPISIDDLRIIYDNKFSEIEMIEQYLSEYLEYCYLGYYDGIDKKTKVTEINFYDVETSLNNLFNQTVIPANESEVEFDLENNERFIFTLQGLRELRDYQTVEEIRMYLDKLIEAGEYIKDTLQDKVMTGKELEEQNKKYKLDKEGSQKFYLKDIRNLILEDVIGQDKAVYDLTREIFINETSKNPRNKSHILVTGPTGTGKTEIIRKLSKIYDKPIFIADANQYTKDGYVGKSVSGMILGLIDAAGGDIEKAQNGIIVVDEIDKKLSGDKDDVGGRAVLNAMLKMSERDIFEVDAGNAGYRNMIQFDTSNLLLIFLGAFEDLYSKKLNENKRAIGFNTERKEITKRDIIITKEDIIKEGFPAELLGRIGSVTSTYSFDEDGLVDLLTKSKISPLLIIKEYLEEGFGIELKVSKGFIREVAKKALKTGTNARELKPILKETIKEALEEIFNGRKAKVLKLRKETVLDNKKYYFE